MRKYAILLLIAVLLTGCRQEKPSQGWQPMENDGTVNLLPTGDSQEVVYLNITAKEAKEIMDTAKDYVILDTRTQDEYDEGHIPGAVLIPYDQIKDQAEGMLTDKNQLILVYCRSGRRSKIAAQTLVDLGYTNIREFGGIIDWPYEVEQ